FFFQAEDGIRDFHVTGVQTCALPISRASPEGVCDTPKNKEPLGHGRGWRAVGRRFARRAARNRQKGRRGPALPHTPPHLRAQAKIGRASCRESETVSRGGEAWKKKEE